MEKIPTVESLEIQTPRRELTFGSEAGISKLLTYWGQYQMKYQMRFVSAALNLCWPGSILVPFFFVGWSSHLKHVPNYPWYCRRQCHQETLIKTLCPANTGERLLEWRSLTKTPKMQSCQWVRLVRWTTRNANANMRQCDLGLYTCYVWLSWWINITFHPDCV